MDNIKWMRRILGGLAGLAGAGAIYQAIATARDKRRYPAPGQRIDVGGFRLHLHCTGTGSPTVVIDSGLGSFSSDWCLVQPELARITRVCTYDRAGYGWSDPGPQPRTSQQIVRELHTLLTSAGIEGPYVLVGYSFGGMNVRLYAHQHPDQVVGVVLVDSAHEHMCSRLPPEFGRMVAGIARMRFPISILSRLGIIRLVIHLKRPKFVSYFLHKLPPELQPLILIPRLWPQYLETLIDESAGFERSAAQLRAIGDNARSLGDMPLVVLTALVKRSVTGWQSLFDLPEEEYKRVWMDLQMDLAGLSTNSTHIVAKESGHGIVIEQPEPVIEAIRQVVEAV